MTSTIPRALAGRTVAITGATGGIGFAIARRFAQEGSNVLLLARNPTALQESLHRIREIVPLNNQMPSRPPLDANTPKAPVTEDKHTSFLLEVQNEDQWKQLASDHPNIDILINAAGIEQASALVSTPTSNLDTILATNLRGVVLGCKYIGKSMWRRSNNQSQGDKCIINVASLLASRGVVGTSVYAASKAGVIGLTTSLSLEFARRRIRVNAIVPGYILTKMTERQVGNEELIKKIPAGRFGEPAEVADAAVFLAKNEYANNCILNLDGGLSAS
ncbi:hypothetical protein B0H63DRAFT_165332 [Podospora didyma]|uniref:3-oxoacyl-[acyl-carrier-protein] reductase n=1 Tax=Podospora didyma TaxID=330526 RepID=A0AAE0U244_9PEZI|nr:hypothetical protein B0H63DRAFT_165332 [Podospora didyma]